MIGILGAIAAETWAVLVDSAPFVLFGLAVAGLLKAFLPEGLVARHLGGASAASVLKAAAFGVPLPLCSCGVVPAAMGLRRQGASKGAVTSFLVSTPETGVDSIAVTWALLDPVMTVVRPVAAFVTAVAAGLLVNLLPQDPDEPAFLRPQPSPDDAQPLAPLRPLSNPAVPAVDGCGCTGCCAEGRVDPVQPRGLAGRLRQAADFAFGELMGDIGVWLLGGIVVAGAIAALVPEGFIERNLGEGILPMLVMLVVGMPMYVCATASTPVVAALALKGLTPGAALVFLLAGPVTNAATIAVLARLLGKRVTVVYVAVIAAASLGLGIAVNALYAALGLDVTRWIAVGAGDEGGLLGIVSAIILLALVARQMLLRTASRGGRSLL